MSKNLPFFNPQASLKPNGLQVNNASYVVLDNDGYSFIEFNTGNTNRTNALPTLLDNLGRTLTCIKTDLGTGKMQLVGEGTDKIIWGTPFGTVSGFIQGDSITVFGTPLGWVVIAHSIGLNNQTSFTYSGSYEDSGLGTSFAREGNKLISQFGVYTGSNVVYFVNGSNFLTFASEYYDHSTDSNVPGHYDGAGVDYSGSIFLWAGNVAQAWIVGTPSVYRLYSTNTTRITGDF